MLWNMPDAQNMKTGLWSDSEVETLKAALLAIATECGVRKEDLWTEWMFCKKAKKKRDGVAGMWYRIHKEYLTHRRPKHIYEKAKALVFANAYKTVRNCWVATSSSLVQLCPVAFDTATSSPSCTFG